MADFRDHVYQRVFLAVLSAWTKYNILGVYPWYIGGARRSTAMWLRERWHRSPFPMFSRLGEVIRDVQETSSEIHLKKMTWNSDIFLCQLKHLGTSWKIFVYHGSQRVCGANPAGPVLVGSGRGTLESLECCHMLPWGDQINEIDESLVVEVLFNDWSVTSVTRIGKPKHRCCNRPCFQEAVRNHGRVDLMQKKDWHNLGFNGI